MAINSLTYPELRNSLNEIYDFIAGEKKNKFGSQDNNEKKTAIAKSNFENWILIFWDSKKLLKLWNEMIQKMGYVNNIKTLIEGIFSVFPMIPEIHISK